MRLTTKQLLIVLIALVLVDLALTIELAKNHIVSGDVQVIVGFLTGAGFVIALMRGGRKK
jgi:hypothetical protein